jgi:hypothetical protein
VVWARRSLLFVGVTLCAFLAATVSVEPAAAYAGSITTAAEWAQVNAYLNEPNQQTIDGFAGGVGPGGTPTTATKPVSAGRWLKARALIGRIPTSIGPAGTALTLCSETLFAAGACTAAAYIGWEIPHTTGVSDWVYAKVAGVSSTPVPQAGTIRTFIKGPGQMSGTVFSDSCYDWPTCLHHPASSAGAIVWGPIVRYSINSGSTWSDRPGSYYTECTPFGMANHGGPGGICDASQWTTCTGGTCLKPLEAAVATVLNTSGFSSQTYGTASQELTVAGDPSPSQITYVFAEPAFSGTAPGDPGYQKSFFDRLQVQEQRTYNASTDAGRKNVTQATTTYPDPHADPDNCSWGGACPAIGTIADDDDLDVEIGRILHPDVDVDGGTTVALPQPQLHETYAHYRSRLRNIGFLGTVTLWENATDAPEFGPDEMTFVQLDTTAGTLIGQSLLDPWPELSVALPIPGEDAEVTIQHNGSDAPPADGSDVPGEIPPGVPPISVGDCTCPAPDFSPVTDIDYGEKFPFGVVVLVSDFLGTTVYASPDAPSFDFDFTEFQAAGFGPYDLGHYVVDLDVLDSYASTVRTLLAFVVWIGGLWWFGSRWFGFKGSGDPGEAVDEAWS